MTMHPRGTFTPRPHLIAASLAALILASMGHGASAAPVPWRNAPNITPAQKAIDDLRKPHRDAREIVPGFIWIDAEDFADYGGWWIDTQFVAFMGSAYLIAAGMCDIVDDATTEVNLPSAGHYRLWVRSRNWFPQTSPGRFKVAVNGKASEKVFGAAPAPKWVWESGGEFDLPAGTARIALQDLTGEYGRCDAIVLTTDMGYTPPDDIAAIARDRARLTGISLEPTDAGEYDVVVVGAGTAGCCAAIASARLGSKTVLIQDRPVLGGNASIELGVGPQGASAKNPNARESGIMEEAVRITAERDYPMVSDAFRELAAAETNLTVMLNRRVIAAEMDKPGRIAAVRAVDTLSGSISRARGREFIDCTGDGWLGFYAGAEYRLGRESREQTGEELAQEKPDKITMSGCIMGRQSLSFRSEDTGEPKPYTPPAWAAKLPPPEEFGRTIKSVTGGNWWLEHEGTVDDLNDPEHARDELIRITFGYWDFIKNKWADRAKAANHALVHVPIWNAKRETRRLIGDYILTQPDVQSGRVFPDRISYGGWSIDIHNPRGIYSGKEGPYHFDPRVPIYTIPYRCLYSKNIDNLLFAGRDMSVTHVALGTVRVESTLATLGQAAGTAAALCIRHATTPRGIYEEHIAELQQTLLKNDQYIPETKNEDPADLARTAKITASSSAANELFRREDVVKDEDSHELAMPRAVILPTGSEPRVDAAWLLLRSEKAEPVELTAHLRGAAAEGDFSSSTDIATAKATARPGAERWVKFDFRATVKEPFFYISLPAARGVEWRLMKKAPAGSCRGYGGSESRPWTSHKGQYYAAATEPPRALPLDMRAENVIDGVARIVGKETHMWSSDPKQALPQWIELDLGTPKSFNAVHLTFDTDMNLRWPAKPLAKQCVRDYEIACDDGSGGWRTLASAKDNFQRWRPHRFPTVTARRIRVTVSKTHGDPAARVFEVRVYND
ncbi:MAG TPA: FAD-dependent oxidoreductase [Verrucomicrobiae bacterium]|nr:FAD-dependent oxidoreductase [Verrucomicrobiae bacterium]